MDTPLPTAAPTCVFPSRVEFTLIPWPLNPVSACSILSSFTIGQISKAFCWYPYLGPISARLSNQVLKCVRYSQTAKWSAYQTCIGIVVAYPSDKSKPLLLQYNLCYGTFATYIVVYSSAFDLSLGCATTVTYNPAIWDLQLPRTH